MLVRARALQVRSQKAYHFRLSLKVIREAGVGEASNMPFLTSHLFLESTDYALCSPELDDYALWARNRCMAEAKAIIWIRLAHSFLVLSTAAQA